MEKYMINLIQQGIAATRAIGLAQAIENLNSELCKLDLAGLRVLSDKGIIGQLDIYAREEGVRNIATELYNNKLRKAVRKIDFDEFPSFSDKLMFLAEEAAEVDIPGAHMICRSLTDLRKLYVLPGMLFSRLAQQAENISQVNGVLDVDGLNLRMTRKYKDAYRHLDDECRLGKVETLRSIERSGADDEDGDSGSKLLFIRVTQDTRIDATPEQIKQAIRDTYTHQGCGCEHDCCRCISQTVGRMKRLRVNNFNDNEIWVIQVSWYRNV